MPARMFARRSESRKLRPQTVEIACAGKRLRQRMAHV